MEPQPPQLDILILRDPRESKKKCSLTPLRGQAGVRFVRYNAAHRVPADGRILLDPDGAPFTAADYGAPLLLIDCSWRRVASLRATVTGTIRRRRLPSIETAYPRVSRNFADPTTGLASIEALYVASLLVGVAAPQLLAEYRWRDDFFARNTGFFASLGVAANGENGHDVRLGSAPEPHF